jgi:heme A synthase
MAVYAFFLIVTGAGDEEKMKKWRRTIVYGLVGFFLIRIPQSIVSALYGSPACKNKGIFTVGSCEIEKQNLEWAVSIIGKIINYINGFLFLICVLLIIYAGWLVLISAGDEEKMKKAKNIIIYVFVGFVILVASHALFRFFILRG